MDFGCVTIILPNAPIRLLNIFMPASSERYERKSGRDRSVRGDFGICNFKSRVH